MDEWDRKSKERPSVWLKLKTKGEVVKVRIASSPLREINVWPSGEAVPGKKPLDAAIVNSLTEGQWMSLMRSPEWDIQEQFVLLVIDRQDGTAKIYRVAPSLYEKIRNYAKNPEWGNPAGYDITITRTESPGAAYWDVTPSPNKSSLLASEVEKIKALDLAKLIPTALPTNVVQPDDIDEMTKPEPLPWTPAPVGNTVAEQRQNIQAAAATEEPLPPFQPDDVITDIGDEPVTLDDINFK